jgi:hypothetical protein
MKIVKQRFVVRVGDEGQSHFAAPAEHLVYELEVGEPVVEVRRADETVELYAGWETEFVVGQQVFYQFPAKPEAEETDR